MESPTFITLTEERFREILTQTAQLGAHNALRMAGLPVREFYTRAEMKRRHGGGVINSLIKAHKLTPHKLPTTNDDAKQRIVYSESEFLSQII